MRGVPIKQLTSIPGTYFFASVCERQPSVPKTFAAAATTSYRGAAMPPDTSQQREVLFV